MMKLFCYILFVLSFTACVNDSKREEKLNKIFAESAKDNTVVVPNGGLQISPNYLEIAPGQTQTFSATGGTSPYSFSIYSGSGTINGTTYTAPATTGSAKVRVTDAKGDTQDSTVVIMNLLEMSPSTKKINVSKTQQMSVSGGTPPYTYSIVSGNGSINSSGLYTAPASSTTAVVKVTDSLSRTDTSTLTIGNGPIITPTSTYLAYNSTYDFNYSSGTGPFTWSVDTASMGSIDSSGIFTPSGTTGTATITITDSSGFSSSATVTVVKYDKTTNGADYSCVLRGESGNTYCWGKDTSYGETNSMKIYIGADSSDMGSNLPSMRLPSDFIPEEVKTGYLQTCVRSTDGRVICVGHNSYGIGGFAENIFYQYEGSITNQLSGGIPFGGSLTAQQIALDYYHACALLSDNSVKCWGYNSNGSAGQDNSSTTVPVSTLSAVNLGQSVKEVQVGQYSSCARLNDNTVKCWGYNVLGELGQNNTTDVGSGAGQMAALSSISLPQTTKKLRTGAYHSCAIMNDDSLMCWGFNGYGQLGRGDTTNIGSAGGANSIVNISAVSLGTGVKASDMCIGYLHTCVLLDDSTVKCFGHNSYGQLGIGSTVAKGDDAGEMGDTLTRVDLGTGRTAKKVACGHYSSCAILDDDTLKCWGYNDYPNPGVSVGGMLGLGLQATGSYTSIGDAAGEMGNNLSTINFGTGATVLDISVGRTSMCAIVEIATEKKVKCWGTNYYGAFGLEDAIMGDASGEIAAQSAINWGTGITVQKIVAGKYATYILTSDGKVKGSGIYVLVGDGTINRGGNPKSMGDNNPFMNFGVGPTVVDIDTSTGYASTCAILSNNTVKCFGSENPNGLLGNDSAAVLYASGISAASPLSLPIGGGETMTQIKIGYYHACVKTDANKLYCWGNNSFGQLGLGDTNDRGSGGGANSITTISSVNVGTGLTVKEFSLGSYASCAILSNDKVKCWGGNTLCGLGIGANSTDHRGDAGGEMGDALPYLNLGTGRTAKKIACSTGTCCVILDNDKVKCWGYGTNGAHGYGKTSNVGCNSAEMGDSLTYVDFGTDRTVVNLSGGYLQACAVLDNNRTKCWGYNSTGQLGTGGFDNIGDGPGEMGDNLSAISFGN